MAVGSVKIEVLESVTGDNYVEESTDLKTGVSEGTTLIQYTPKAGVTKAKFKITEEGSGPVMINSLVAGIK